MNRTVILSLEPLKLVRPTGGRRELMDAYKSAYRNSFDEMVKWLSLKDKNATLSRTREMISIVPMIEVTAEDSVIKELLERQSNLNWISRISINDGQSKLRVSIPHVKF